MLCTVYSGHRLATVRPDRLEQLLIACAQRGEVPGRKIKRRNGVRILTPREKRSPHRETPWKKSSVYLSRGTVCSAAGNPAACTSYTRGHLRRHGTHRAPVYPPCTTSVRSAAMYPASTRESAPDLNERASDDDEIETTHPIDSTKSDSPKSY